MMIGFSSLPVPAATFNVNISVFPPFIVFTTVPGPSTHTPIRTASPPSFNIARSALTFHNTNVIMSKIGIDWSGFDLFAIERQQKILELLSQNGKVTISELVSLFDTSHETIRKDLVYLEQQNALKRIYGGAVSVDAFCNLQALSTRKTQRIEQKNELCLLAARFIQENDIIAIDEGSTAVELAKIIVSRFRNLTVLTHNLEVFQILSENSNFSIILCGGKFVREENAFSGHFAIQIANQMHTQKAFICPASVSHKYGITDFGEAFIPIQRGYAENTDKVIVLADSLKIETSSPYKICDLTEDITIVTDSCLDNKLFKLYKDRKLDIIRTDVSE